MLKQDLGLFPYKVQLVQKLKRGDKAARLRFCKWALAKVKARCAFLHNLLMSDEAVFDVNGNVNKQNCRYWSEAPPS